MTEQNDGRGEKEGTDTTKDNTRKPENEKWRNGRGELQEERVVGTDSTRMCVLTDFPVLLYLYWSVIYSARQERLRVNDALRGPPSVGLRLGS